VIHYLDTPEDTIYMLHLYSKSEQGDLTAQQVRTLARLVREELG